MKKKKTIYDWIAALAFVFDVDWEEEYAPSEAADYFWDTESRLKFGCGGRAEDIFERDAV